MVLTHTLHTPAQILKWKSNSHNHNSCDTGQLLHIEPFMSPTALPQVSKQVCKAPGFSMSDIPCSFCPISRSPEHPAKHP